MSGFESPSKAATGMSEREQQSLLAIMIAGNATETDAEGAEAPLTSLPVLNTDELRKGFLAAFDSLLAAAAERARGMKISQEDLGKVREAAKRRADTTKAAVLQHKSELAELSGYDTLGMAALREGYDAELSMALEKCAEEYEEAAGEMARAHEGWKAAQALATEVETARPLAVRFVAASAPSTKAKEGGSAEKTPHESKGAGTKPGEEDFLTALGRAGGDAYVEGKGGGFVQLGSVSGSLDYKSQAVFEVLGQVAGPTGAGASPATRRAEGFARFVESAKKGGDEGANAVRNLAEDLKSAQAQEVAILKAKEEDSRWAPGERVLGFILDVKGERSGMFHEEINELLDSGRNDSIRRALLAVQPAKSLVTS